MRMLNQITRLLVLLVCCVSAMAVLAQPAKTASEKTNKASASARVAHPEVDPAQDCSTCHAAQYKQWDASRHATGGVLCVVCHGSLSENFVKVPAITRCEGCHAAQVENLEVSASARKGNRCFVCHSPHTLKVKREGTKSPHASVEIGGNQ